MVKIREKSIRTLSIINYESLEQEWNKKAKENSELTEEDAQKYLNERTDAMLALCDSYGYDGCRIDYTGLSMVGMQEAVLQQYKTRQQSTTLQKSANRTNNTHHQKIINNKTKKQPHKN